MNRLIPERIQGEPLAPAQQQYLEGFFNGLAARGITFGEAAVGPAPEEDSELTAEERIKREEHPLDSYHRIADNARAGVAPDKEDTFRFKWHGLFYLSPVKDAYMARLRIPGGQLTASQFRSLAQIAGHLTTGYVQVTTRANLQMRLIRPADAPEFLRRVRLTGLHTQGSGADNIRNITANPTAGVDPHELINCTRLVHDLADRILNRREFYNLPRKFNIAFDGGGLIGSVEDTNDIGLKAVPTPDGVAFRIALGGATGHQAFATDAGVQVAPEEVVDVVTAMIRVFLENGDRTTRKKARLKHLLEKWPAGRFLAETDRKLGRTLPRIPAPPAATVPQPPHSHVGPHAQKQPGLNWLGVAIPVGQISPKQMQRIADLAEDHGSGDIRLTVWQNLVIPNIPDASLSAVQKAVVRAGLDWRQSNATSGIIACTGNRYCKYAATDTKGHAIALAKRIEKRVKLDQPVNIHFTGCPHSCAQHYMGDIGLLGTRTRDGSEAYHLFVGGGFGANQAIGRQLFQAMPFEEVVPVIERLLQLYLDRRAGAESFQAFTARHDVNQLQTFLS